MRAILPPFVLLALLTTADAITPTPDWFSHLLEGMGQLGALVLYMERRLTKLETKLDPLWNRFTKEENPAQQHLFKPARD